jgi:hypothetical protein
MTSLNNFCAAIFSDKVLTDLIPSVKASLKDCDLFLSVNWIEESLTTSVRLEIAYLL